MAEEGEGEVLDLEKFKYASWKDVPEGCLRDVVESIATGQPSSLDLDTIIKSVDDLAIVMKTLNEQTVRTRDGTKPGHSVTTISMRYCPALRREEALPLLCELCTTQWENDPEPGVVQDGPTIVIVEALYLDGSVGSASTGAIEAAWKSSGHLHKPAGERPEGHPFTLRRKPTSYMLGGETRELDRRKGGVGLPNGAEHHVDLQVYRAVFGEPDKPSNWEERVKAEGNSVFLQPKKDFNGNVMHEKGEPVYTMLLEQANAPEAEAANKKKAGGGGDKKGGKKKK